MFGNSQSTILNFEGKPNFQNVLYSCPLPCWHFLAHIKFHLPERRTHPLRTSSREWVGTNFTFTFWFPLPASNGTYHQRIHTEGLFPCFARIMQTLGSINNEFQTKNLAENLCGPKAYSNEGCTTQQNPMASMPTIELVSWLGAKGLPQCTDPFVAHFQFSRPLAEQRRHQKEHCQASATKSCMARFSQGRFVEHLGKPDFAGRLKGLLLASQEATVHRVRHVTLELESLAINLTQADQRLNVWKVAKLWQNKLHNV